MAGNEQQTVATTFWHVAGDTAGKGGLEDIVRLLAPAGSKSLPEALAEASREAVELRLIATAQAEALGLNTQAVTQNTSAQGSGGGIKEAASTVGKIASNFLGGGLTVMPLISGIAKLFGGGGSSQQAAAPVRFEMPEPLKVEATSGWQAVSYGQDGLPRAVRPASPIQQSTIAAEPVAAAATAAPAPQITVQVQAMDSRSFLDHSHEIARAVREAMLSVNALNDVVSEL